MEEKEVIEFLKGIIERDNVTKEKILDTLKTISRNNNITNCIIVAIFVFSIVLFLLIFYTL